MHHPALAHAQLARGTSFLLLAWTGGKHSGNVFPLAPHRVRDCVAGRSSASEKCGAASDGWSHNAWRKCIPDRPKRPRARPPPGANEPTVADAWRALKRLAARMDNAGPIDKPVRNEKVGERAGGRERPGRPQTPLAFTARYRGSYCSVSLPFSFDLSSLNDLAL